MAICNTSRHISIRKQYAAETGKRAHFQQKLEIHFFTENQNLPYYLSNQPEIADEIPELLPLPHFETIGQTVRNGGNIDV